MAKQGETPDRIEIKSPHGLQGEDKHDAKIIIIPTGDMADQIINELKIMGFDESNYCFANDIIISFNYFYNKKIVIPNASICVTTKCTLNCHGCSEYIPYLKEQRNIEMEIIKRDIDLLFNKVDFCGEIAFSAGENFLNEELGEIIDYIYSKYSNKYLRIACNTNGTVLIKTNILQSIKKANCQIRISDYPASSKIEQIIQLLKENDIRYLVNDNFSFGTNRRGTWFDFGIPLVSHNKSIEEKKYLFRNCQLYCRMLHNGTFYYCPTQFGATVSGLYNANRENDILNLAKAKEIDIIKFFLGYNDNGYINFCDRCDGMGSAINKNTIPAGIQMSKDEMEKLGNRSNCF